MNLYEFYICEPFIPRIYAEYTCSGTPFSSIPIRVFLTLAYMSCCMRKHTVCIGENKDTDQPRGNREADQRLCFRYTDRTLALLFLNPKFQASSCLCDCTFHFTRQWLFRRPRGKSQSQQVLAVLYRMVPSERQAR